MNLEQHKHQYDKQYLKALLYSALSDLFSKIDSEGREVIEKNVTIESLSARSCLFNEGDQADKIYFLLIGKLQVYVNDEQAAGQLRKVGYLSAGQILGEVSLYTEERIREASVFALRDSYLASIDMNIIENLSAKYPVIHQRIVKSLIRKLDNINQEKLKPQSDSITTIIPFRIGALAKFFLRELDTYAKKKDECMIFNSSTINSYPSVRDASKESFSIRLESLLLELESTGKKIFLVTDDEFKLWTNSCLRNCDKVILLHEGKSSPELCHFEKEIMDYFKESHIRPKLELILLNEGKKTIKNTEDWLKLRPNTPHYHIDPKLQSDLGRAYRLLSNQQTGIVFSGGGMPGIAHAGVYRAFHEAGFVPDFVGGTSIGAYIAAGVANNWDSETIAKKLKLAFSVNPMKDFTIPTLSLVSGKRLDAVLKKIFKKRVEDYAYPFFCVAADLLSGEEVILERGVSHSVLMASSAIPGVFPPIQIGNHICSDGGVINNLPGDVLLRKGAKNIIAVDFTSQLGSKVRIPDTKFNVKAWFKQKKGKPDVKDLDIFTVLIRSGLVNSERKIEQVKKICDYYIKVKSAPRHFMDNSNPEMLIEDGYKQGLAFLEEHPDLKYRLFKP